MQHELLSSGLWNKSLQHCISVHISVSAQELKPSVVTSLKNVCYYNRVVHIHATAITTAIQVNLKLVKFWQQYWARIIKSKVCIQTRDIHKTKLEKHKDFKEVKVSTMFLNAMILRQNTECANSTTVCLLSVFSYIGLDWFAGWLPQESATDWLWLYTAVTNPASTPVNSE